MEQIVVTSQIKNNVFRFDISDKEDNSKKMLIIENNLILAKFKKRFLTNPKIMIFLLSPIKTFSEPAFL